MKDFSIDRDWIIIPDIHGRTFWKEAIKGHENGNIVFLGDYLDPYSFEGISPAQATLNLEEIIAFKKEHMNSVVLLLGNHDLGYLDRRVCKCRHDYPGEAYNRKLLLDNLELFDLVHITSIRTHKVLFSHAGLSKNWIRVNGSLFGDGRFSPGVLNEMLHDKSTHPNLMQALAQVSFYRGGYDDCGSPVWADANELLETGDFFPGYLHVFGHTLHAGGPVLIRAEQGDGWCMDCAEGFRMDQNGQMHYLDEGY